MSKDLEKMLSRPKKDEKRILMYYLLGKVCHRKLKSANATNIKDNLFYQQTQKFCLKGADYLWLTIYPLIL